MAIQQVGSRIRIHTSRDIFCLHHANISFLEFGDMIKEHILQQTKIIDVSK